MSVMSILVYPPNHHAMHTSVLIISLNKLSAMCLPCITYNCKPFLCNEKVIGNPVSVLTDHYSFSWLLRLFWLNWEPLDLHHHILSTAEVFSCKCVNTFPLVSRIFYTLFKTFDTDLIERPKTHVFAVLTKNKWLIEITWIIMNL